MNLRASWNGSIADGWATFGSGSFLTEIGAGGAFLKLGSFGFGLGAEKNDVSSFASLTAGATGLVSFFTTTGFEEEGVPTAGFLGGGAFLTGRDSLGFRFFAFKSIHILR